MQCVGAGEHARVIQREDGIHRAGQRVHRQRGRQGAARILD
jgi:hypothetical protein